MKEEAKSSSERPQARASSSGSRDAVDAAGDGTARRQTSPLPGLVFVHRRSSGRCRRVEGFLAQVLQRRANHGSFRMYTVDADEHPEVAEKFNVDTVPTLLVVEQKRVQGRLDDPRGCRDIERFLAPWLR